MSAPHRAVPARHPDGMEAGPQEFSNVEQDGTERVLRWEQRSDEKQEISYAQDELEFRGSTDNGLWIYRDRTTALLRRYCRFAVEVGRLPSLLGREFFRTRITYYRTSTFEDTVIFVHDVERCLEELDPVEKELIARIVLQDYTQEETAALMGCGYRTVARRFPETLDRVTEVFLQRRLLIRIPDARGDSEKSCQEGESSNFCANDLKQSE
jgi:predicted DNA-binding protein (UPF0251 family)